jgi:hypothetical protein
MIFLTKCVYTNTDFEFLYTYFLKAERAEWQVCCLLDILLLSIVVGGGGFFLTQYARKECI